MHSPPRLPAALLALVLVLVLGAPPARAQGSGITSPGMPALSSGQTDRFSRDFNPAISLVIDSLADHVESSGAGEDGTRLELRTTELLAAAWIDPNAWVYATVASDGEELLLEEASIQYLGLGDAYTLRAGRFFIDFGKQMQAHVHDLRTVNRPLVLREFLGEEVSGDGLQWDHWFPTGDASLLRYSVGVFQDLAAHEHGEEHGGEEHIEAEQDDRRDAADLNFSARATWLSDVGDSGQLQLGASSRVIPDLRYVDEDSGAESAGDSSVVYGLDLTYGWQDATATSSWTLGGEWLRSDGALSASETPGGLEVNDGHADGFYAFVDHGFDRNTSAGLQYSRADALEVDAQEAEEYDLYVTRLLSEFLRLRLGLTYFEDEEGDDGWRFAIQFTGYVGPHDHGINW